MDLEIIPEVVDDDALETPDDEGVLIDILFLIDLWRFPVSGVDIGESDGETSGCWITIGNNTGEFNVLIVGVCILFRFCGVLGCWFCCNLDDVGRPAYRQFPMPLY